MLLDYFYITGAPYGFDLHLRHLLCTTKLQFELFRLLGVIVRLKADLLVFNVGN